jgi:hypothetical protein
MTSVSQHSISSSNSTAKSSDQKFGSIYTHHESREANSSSCGTAQELQFLVGNFENETCRPGIYIESENETKNSEIGRERDDTVGAMKTNYSGVSRGHGV